MEEKKKKEEEDKTLTAANVVCSCGSIIDKWTNSKTVWLGLLMSLKLACGV